MVPVSNAVEGLWFWSKRERLTIHGSLEGRKIRVCQQMSSMLTFCFNWRRHGHCVCIFIGACRYHFIITIYFVDKLCFGCL